jgi:CubicO group peptidase (beta-lactamase class C family)
MMLLSRRSICALWLVIAAAAACVPDKDAAVARVENGLVPPVRVRGDKGWNILERMKFYNIPGVSVAVFDGERVLWAKGYGVKDVATGEPVTEQTLFVAGSISKPVAVMGALRLVQEGKLSLDENVNTYLKSWHLPENEFTGTEKVTLRRIMSHSAGLTVHGFGGYASGRPVPSLVQVLDGAAPANSPPIRVDTVPGTIWRYSGGGTTVMQQAMIDVEGRPFPEIMAEKVLGPLGMTSSSYEQDMSPERFALAASGHSDGRALEGKTHKYPEMAAAGLWTTPTDLAKFAMAARLIEAGKSRQVLSPEIARLMFTPQIKIGPGSDMALGFFLEDHAGSVYFGHGGGDAGFVCQLIASKDGGYGAAIMTNADNRPDRLINEILQSIAIEYKWKDYVAPVVEPVPLGPGELAPFVGRYKISTDEVLTIALKEDHLEGRTTERPAAELVPVSRNEFVHRDGPERLVFAAAENGISSSVILRAPRSELTAERMPEGVMTPFEMLLAGKIEAAVAVYRDLKARDPKDEAVDENRLNSVGYGFLRDKKLAEAIAVFKLNVELYPQSWNVYDSLAEGYMNKGDNEQAILNYEKSLALNPNNVNGEAMLRKLKGESPDSRT